jgi:hypothetical protein
LAFLNHENSLPLVKSPEQEKIPFFPLPRLLPVFPHEFSILSQYSILFGQIAVHPGKVARSNYLWVINPLTSCLWPIN